MSIPRTNAAEGNDRREKPRRTKPYKRALFVSLLCLLTACTEAKHTRSATLPAATEQEKVIAVHATNRLRELLSHGACDEEFHDIWSGRHVKLSNWTIQCESLRQDLGTWKDFRIGSATSCDMPKTVLLDGFATFERDRFDVLLCWSLRDSHRPELLFIRMGREGKVWSQIPEDEAGYDMRPYTVENATRLLAVGLSASNALRSSYEALMPGLTYSGRNWETMTVARIAGQ